MTKIKHLQNLGNVFILEEHIIAYGRSLTWNNSQTVGFQSYLLTYVHKEYD